MSELSDIKRMLEGQDLKLDALSKDVGQLGGAMGLINYKVDESDKKHASHLVKAALMQDEIDKYKQDRAKIIGAGWLGSGVVAWIISFFK